MAKLFGCPINLEPEEKEVDDGRTIAVDFFRSRNQPDVESTSLSAGLPPLNQRETNIPFFRFLDSNSDSESVSMESESDLNRCFIDFFDRDSFIGSNQRLSSTSFNFDIWGSQDMEVEIELGLRIGSGSGSDDSGGLGLQVPEIDPRRIEIDTGRVEIDPVRAEIDPSHIEIETGRVEVETGLTVEDMIVGEEEPVESNILPREEVEIFSWLANSQGDEPMDQEWHDAFFDTLLEEVGTDFLPRIDDEFAENHGEDDYEDVLARTFEESEINGSPPASKRVVDELPDVGITSEELSIGCAICKDEIVGEERVKRLPCKHYYHGECIVPWLGIRNTCPVCRYELPTDDVEYERSKRSQRRRLDVSNIFLV